MIQSIQEIIVRKRITWKRQIISKDDSELKKLSHGLKELWL